MFIKCLLIILVCGTVFANFNRKHDKRSLSDSCENGNCDQPLSNPLSDEIKFWSKMLVRLHSNRNKLQNILYKKIKN